MEKKTIHQIPSLKATRIEFFVRRRSTVKISVCSMAFDIIDFTCGRPPGVPTEDLFYKLPVITTWSVDVERTNEHGGAFIRQKSAKNEQGKWVVSFF